MKAAASLAWFGIKLALFLLLYFSASEVTVIAYQQF